MWNFTHNWSTRLPSRSFHIASFIYSSLFMCYCVIHTYTTLFCYPKHLYITHHTPILFAGGVRTLHNNTGDKRISAAKVDYIFYLAKISLSFIAKN